MDDRGSPESIEERNLRMIVSSAVDPAAPPLPPGLPARLAERSRAASPDRFDWPLAAAGCCALGLLILSASLLLPAGRMDFRWWVAAIPAVNLILSPFAAGIVIWNMRREASNAKT